MKKIATKIQMKKITNNIVKKKSTKVVALKAPSESIDKKMDSKNSKIVPLGSRVLIRPFTKEELEKRNNFGIILPDSNTKEKSEQGVVLAVGPGEFQDGKRITPAVSVGDKVCFSKYGYDDVTVDGEELYLIKEENILAILK